MRKKCPLTLLELMIGLSLLSIILFFLLSPFKEVAILSGRMGKASSSVLQKHRVQSRLTKLLSQIEDDFSCDSKQLQCSTKIGADPIPELSSSVHMKLFLTKEKDLTLRVWPKEQEEKQTKHLREQVIAKNISSISWKMYKIENGKVETHTSWEDKTPPDYITLSIDGYEIPFTLTKKPGGIAL